MSKLLDIDGFVLTGGASSRMGQDKSRIKLGGKTLAERAIRTLRQVCTEVFTVGDLSFSTAPVVKDFDRSDDAKYHAAIFGVHSALANSDTEWTAILACDLPFVTPELFRLLFSKTKKTANSVVPVQRDGRRQPLCALYRTKLTLVGVEEALELNDLSMQKLLDRIGTVNIDFTESSQLKNAEYLFFNVNTLEDLELARSLEKQN